MPNVKPGVNFWPGLHPRLEADIEEIDRVHVRIVGRGAIITSARDGTHSPESLHYSGKALDFRTNDLSTGEKWALRAALSDALGPDYDVLLEYIGEPREHGHLELDPDT